VRGDPRPRDPRPGSNGHSRWWAAGLWAALLAGILVAWSQRNWPASVAITSISIVTICWIVRSLLVGMRDFELLNQPWSARTVLVALIGSWGFLQMAFHTTLLPQLTLDRSIVLALSACAFVMGSQMLRERASREFFLELLLWSATLLGFIAMVQFYSTPTRVFGIFPAEASVTGTFLSHNRFAALMELALPIALWHMLERNAVSGGFCCVMILAATITSASRAGVILLGVELVVFLGLVLLARRREAKVIALFFAGLVALVIVASIVAGTDRVKARFEDKDPFTVRRELFYSTLKLIEQRPWTGYGMGTWRTVYPQTATFDVDLIANDAHNDWAQWTSDGGIPFLLLMTALVVGIAKPATQSIWGLGVVIVMVHSSVDFPLREPVISFVWFAMAGAVSQFDGRNSGRRNRTHANARNSTFDRDNSGGSDG
jgi:O-antigen ligase